MKLHIGCGSRIIPGYDNLDGEPIAGAIKWWAPKMPYAPGSVNYIYSEHFIEHLDKKTCIDLFVECKRVMSRGAIMRIITPDLCTIFEDFANGVYTNKYKQVGWEPKTATDFVNEAMRLWGHQYLWAKFDLHAELRRIFGDASVQYCEYDPKIESRPNYKDCIIEVKKL